MAISFRFVRWLGNHIDVFTAHQASLPAFLTKKAIAQRGVAVSPELKPLRNKGLTQIEVRAQK